MDTSPSYRYGVQASSIYCSIIGAFPPCMFCLLHMHTATQVQLMLQLCPLQQHLHNVD